MAKSLNDYEKLANYNPKKFIWKFIGWFLVISVVLSVIGFTLGIFGEAATVAKEEFGPRAALKKYEWFKDASAQLEAKKRDISVYTTNINNMKTDYEGIRRKDWDRVDKEQFNQWNLEIAGLKASFNGLAADYNAASQKFNWNLFEGEPVQLQRDFAKYVEN